MPPDIPGGRVDNCRHSLRLKVISDIRRASVIMCRVGKRTVLSQSRSSAPFRRLFAAQQGAEKKSSLPRRQGTTWSTCLSAAHTTLHCPSVRGNIVLREIESLRRSPSPGHAEVVRNFHQLCGLRYLTQRLYDRVPVSSTSASTSTVSFGCASLTCTPCTSLSR